MNKPKPREDIHWLSPDDYNKAVFQLRGAILTQLDRDYPMYGYKETNPGTANILVKLAEDFSLRVRGIDKEIKAD